MRWHANSAGLIRDRALHRLTHPPRGIGGEAIAQLRIELLHRAQQADVAFLNQIIQRHTATRVTARDGHDEFQVVVGELIPKLTQPMVGGAPGLIAHANRRRAHAGCTHQTQQACANTSHLSLQGCAP